MRTDTLERMAAAELRMMDSEPDTLAKVKLLKHRYRSIFCMREQDFERITRLALALNIRDGYCKNIRKRLGNDEQK